jgi:ABC-type transport system involved in multi-copper enzyme maturation permease subunit
MFRLLSIEYLKLKYNRASKILIIVYFGLLASIAALSSMSFNIGPIPIKFAEQGIFEFPYIWHFTTWVAAIFKFFLLLVIVSMVSNEYANRTLKQNLIDGLSKTEFVTSKFLMVGVLSIMSTIFVGLTSLILGMIFSSHTSVDYVTVDLQYLGAYCLKLFTFFSFGLFLGILVKRSAFAVGALIIWYIIEKITIGLISSNVKFTEKDSLLNLLPLESTSALIHEPVTRMQTIKQISESVSGDFMGYDYNVPMINVIAASAWCVIFFIASNVLIKKRDL